MGKDLRMLQMDSMIAFIMQIAVSVCRLTVYGSVNDVVAVIFLTHLRKVMQ